MVDILEEYYPEGSDIHPIMSSNHRYILGNTQATCYYWLPPPNYPTHIPSFKAREETLRQDVNDVSLFKCEDGSLIADVLVCNGRKDCKNSEDEQQYPMCSSAISDL